MLRNGYIPHLKAFEVFKSHLPAVDRAAIDHAWDEYCYPEAIPQDPDEKREFRFINYRSIEDSDGIDEAKKTAIQHINKILEFAKTK